MEYPREQKAIVLGRYRTYILINEKKENIWSASEVQNGGSATVDNVLQSKPNADNDLFSNGTTSNVSCMQRYNIKRKLPNILPLQGLQGDLI